MKKFNILRVSAKNINFFENTIFDIDFTNQMQVSNYDENHPYYQIGSTIYLPKVVGFNGVNAAGKTSVFEMIDLFIYFYFDNYSIDMGISSDFLKKAFGKNEVKLTLFFEQEGTVFKITTSISYRFDDANGFNLFNETEGHYVIGEEKIYSKPLRPYSTKTSLYKDGFKLLYDREKISANNTEVLKDDYSIISFLKAHTAQEMITEIEGTPLGLTPNANNDFYIHLGAFHPQIIQFLDPSIQEIIRILPNKINPQKTNVGQPPLELFSVRFKSGEVRELTNMELANTLSSGTIRGFQILVRAKEVLQTGGVLLIDDLGLHLNKSIIADIIKLFNTPDTNPHNACLIFSTHYTEILDLFERNDQIFIVHRNKNFEIKISNYSCYDKKNQLKKSDAYFADTYELGTAVSYDKYLELIRFFRKIHGYN